MNECMPNKPQFGVQRTTCALSNQDDRKRVTLSVQPLGATCSLSDPIVACQIRGQVHQPRISPTASRRLGVRDVWPMSAACSAGVKPGSVSQQHGGSRRSGAPPCQRRHRPTGAGAAAASKRAGVRAQAAATVSTSTVLVEARWRQAVRSPARQPVCRAMDGSHSSAPHAVSCRARCAR